MIVGDRVLISPVPYNILNKMQYNKSAKNALKIGYNSHVAVITKLNAEPFCISENIEIWSVNLEWEDKNFVHEMRTLEGPVIFGLPPEYLRLVR